MLSADGGYDGALASDDFGVIFGVHSDGQLVAPECLWRGRCKRHSGLHRLYTIFKKRLKCLTANTIHALRTLLTRSS